MNTFPNHRTAALNADELTAEIDEAFRLGSSGPRFCGAKYISHYVCQRIGNHEGEHVTVADSGRLVGFDA